MPGMKRRKHLIFWCECLASVQLCMRLMPLSYMHWTSRRVLQGRKNKIKLKKLITTQRTFNAAPSTWHSYAALMIYGVGISVYVACSTTTARLAATGLPACPKWVQLTGIYVAQLRMAEKSSRAYLQNIKLNKCCVCFPTTAQVGGYWSSGLPYLDASLKATSRPWEAGLQLPLLMLNISKLQVIFCVFYS